MGSNNVVLVSGSSTGMGRVTAERLARAGHTVWAGMRDPQGRNAAAAGELRALASQEGLQLRPVPLDVQSNESVKAAVEAVLAESGRIDVLMNNAGLMYPGIAESYTPEQLTTQLDVNLVGAFRLVKAVLPAMRAQRSGLLLHTSSVYGRIVSPFCGIYHASKFGLEGLMTAIAYEVHLQGIDTVLIEPGPFRTNLAGHGIAPDDAHILGAYGPVAEALETWGRLFGEFMATPMPQTDPALVADAVLELIALPSGQRPLRKVVGIPYGCEDFNAAVAPIERGMLEGAQLGFLMKRG